MQVIIKSVRTGDYITRVYGAHPPAIHTTSNRKFATRFANHAAAENFLRRHHITNLAFEIEGA